MKLVISYDIEERTSGCYCGGTHPNHKSGIYTERNYKDIKIDFSWLDNDELLYKSKQIIEHEDYSDEDKVKKLKSLLGVPSNEYEFHYRECEIYYDDQPPSELFIEIGHENDDSGYRSSHATYDNRYPVTVYLKKPTHYVRELLTYQYMPPDDDNYHERYVLQE